MRERPFRSPHHTVSPAGLSGGGAIPRPGEISLAHHGVLFLDEFPEFSRASMEVLRQPIEDGKITISRATASLTYPCSTMIVCAMNPCPCGFYGDSKRECTCPDGAVKRYLAKVSGPMLDRIDMHLAVRPVSEEILKENPSGMSTAEMKAIVTETAEIQRARYKGRGILFNSRLQEGDLEEFCRLGKNGETLLRAAYTKFGMSMRAYNKILKVARTIADIAKSEDIKEQHVAEALSYRALERFYRK
jgi:magnesium chelatase family protein